MAGYFAFGGKIVNALERSPFDIESGGDAWTRQLAGFGWLRHLRAADRPADRARGRVLVGQFLDALGRPSPHPAWQPRVTARRLLSWLSQSPVILAGADHDFYASFMRALARHGAQLRSDLAAGLAGGDRLLVALALAEYGLCVEGGVALQRGGTDVLASEITAQILPDGGHVSRNPQVIIDLLLDLLPLRQAYAARAVPAPQPVLNAIDRMIPMLRLFRHGDGTLALFNGMGPTAPELVATILAYDDIRAEPLTNAHHTGYQRVDRGTTLLVADTGPPPPAPYSTSAHAGCLSFELSSGPSRLVVNCGAFEGGRAEAREAARSTAAHSTLTVRDTSSCRFARRTGVQRWLGDQVLAGPGQVGVARAHDATGTALTLSHDGYASAFALIHHRLLVLAEDGARLDGCDSLLPQEGRPAEAGRGDLDYVLRFHLAPGVRARTNGDGVRLEVPDGEIWLFEADAAAFVEPSILFAAAGGPRPTTQIRVPATTKAAPELHWSFRQLAPPQRRR